MTPPKYLCHFAYTNARNAPKLGCGIPIPLTTLFHKQTSNWFTQIEVRCIYWTATMYVCECVVCVCCAYLDIKIIHHTEIKWNAWMSLKRLYEYILVYAEALSKYIYYYDWMRIIDVVWKMCLIVFLVIWNFIEICECSKVFSFDLVLVKMINNIIGYVLKIL